MIIFYFIVGFIISFLFYKTVIPEITLLKKMFLISCRGILISIILIFIFSPIINFSMERKKREKILLLIDNSLSMENKIKGKTKLNIIENFYFRIEKFLKNKQYEIKTGYFSDGVSGNKNITSLKKTLKFFAKEDYKSIFLLSDGQFDDDTFSFLDFSVPIHTFGYNYFIDSLDVKISEIEIPEIGFINDLQPIKLFLSSNKKVENLRLNLFVDNKNIKSIPINKIENNEEIKFNYFFKSKGIKSVRAEITIVENETNKVNNVQEKRILIKDEKPVIVCIADQLNWDLSFILKTLNKNKKITKEVYTYSNEQLFLKQEKSDFSSAIENANILLISVEYSLYLKDDHIKILQNFLNSGRSLFFIGNPNVNFESIININNVVSKRGIESNIILHPNSKYFSAFSVLEKNISELPPVDFYLVEPKKETKTLIQSNTQQFSPIVFYSKNGEKKIFTIVANNFWKVQLLNLGYENFIDYIFQFLLNDSNKRFLAVTDRIEYVSGEEIIVNLNAYDEIFKKRNDVVAKLFLSKNDSLISKWNMSQNENGYSLMLENLLPGKYNFEVIDMKTKEKTKNSFVILNSGKEKYQIDFNNELLMFIAKKTNGSYSLLENLPSIDKSKEYKLKKIKLLHLYKNKYLLSVLFLIFTIELFFRRRWGLL